jgi:hypothetical protein
MEIAAFRDTCVRKKKGKVRVSQIITPVLQFDMNVSLAEDRRKNNKNPADKSC